MTFMDKAYYGLCFCAWALKWCIRLLAICLIIWFALSWHDIIKDNITPDDKPLSEGNFFVEILEATEWAN